MAGLVFVIAAATVGCMNAESVTPGSGLVDSGSGSTFPDVPVVADLPVPSDKTRLGALCIQGSECESGFCVEGVCCESACDGACKSCVTSSAAGRCVPADVGTDPHNDCADTGVDGCGTDGDCDGSGACRRYPAGAICKALACTGAMLTPASRCDGVGACVAGAQQSCAPFTCAPDKCNAACAGDGDCLAPATCVAGTCGKKPPGAACANATQCVAAFCEQGVCCNRTCAGACESCSLTGSAGTCTKIPVAMNALCPETCSAAMACAAPAVCGGGFCGGLRAQYFDAMDLTLPKLSRTDATIDFNWANTAPDGTIAQETWSVRWLGRVVPRFSETYTFFTVADDGVRLWVNNIPVIDDWTNHIATERNGMIALMAGQPYDVRMEYFNNVGAASVRLLWSSTSEPKAVIPTSSLRP